MESNYDMLPVEFVGGPLDGKGWMHPLQNTLCLKVEGSPEGYYSINPYQPDSKLYWLTLKREE